MNKKDYIIQAAAVLFVIVIFIFGDRRFSAKPRVTSTVVSVQAQTQDQATTTPVLMEIKHGDTSKKEVIFTFDGGAGSQSGDEILAVLAKHQVKGTFFLTGKFVEANPDLVRRMAAAGNELFSHTYDHPDLTTISDDAVAAELTKMAAVLQTTAGLSPKPYFRPPYGAIDNRVMIVAAQNGYQSVGWTVDASDWKEPQGETAEQVKEIIFSTIAPGNIYLMHVGDDITGEILDEVFTTIESRGYKIVSLTQGL